MENTETTITFFDRTGGMTFDTTKNSLDYWGGWTTSDSSRAISILSIYVPPCNRYFGCVLNCMTVNLAKEILKSLHRKLKAVMQAIGCTKCLFEQAGIPCTKCLNDLTNQIPIIGQILDIIDCQDKCKKEVEDLCCKSDKVYCDGKLIWLKCDTDTGMLGNAEILGSPGPCQKCIKDRIVSLEPDDCRPEVRAAHDPNIKYGPAGAVEAGQKLDYKVEFENEGEGIAFGVYFTDTLDEDLDDSTLAIGPAKDVKSDAVIGEPGTYYPNTRTITWFVGNGGEVGSKEGGYADLSVNVRSDAPRGTEIINYGTVYFPSVPEETRTNAIVSIIPANEICGNGIDDDGDGLIDCDAPECFGQYCPEVCDDGWDNDGDSFVDCADTDCPPCPELCDDGLDNDRDGLVDCDDPDCAGDPVCAGASEICNNSLDDDGDGLIDCDDPDCEIDNDGDGYFALPCGNDCNDTNPNMNPGKPEVCNGTDDNCNGVIDDDDSCIAPTATLRVKLGGNPGTRDGFTIYAVKETCYQAQGKDIAATINNCEKFGQGITIGGETTFPVALPELPTKFRIVGFKCPNIGALAGRTPTLNVGGSAAVRAHQVKGVTGVACPR